LFVKEGLWPGIQYPRVPGHEVAGIIDELGAGVTAWTKGQRVGVGWHGGHDNTCIECRRGRFLHCRNPRVAGITFDGRYQQYMVAPVEALAALPNTLSDAEAAPMLCAGVTTFNALRYSGGAGQPSRRARCRGPRPPRNPICKQVRHKVAAIGRGPENSVLAKKLGASVYIDSQSSNAAQELQKLGGAQAILGTAPSSKAMSELIDGLARTGKFIVAGISSDPIEVTPLQLITGERSVAGSAVGTPTDSEDTLQFAELTGVRTMIETYPLDKAAEAYARMMSGKAQFRVVLTT